MSILLEALRKSEKKQRSREAPTIHSEVPSSQPTRSSGPVTIVLLIVVTLVVSGWYVWQQYRLPENEGQLSGEENSGRSDPVLQTSSPSSNQDPADEGPTVAGRDLSSTQSPVVDENGQSPRSRTPMESYQPPVSDATSMANEDLAKNRRAPSGPDQTRQVRAFSTASDTSPKGDSETGDPDDTDSAEPVSRSREPEPISYWELPDAIRADVPLIKYTVLVYNKNPAERFVLINGERLGEGDSYQPGLVVKEIRRDGVIFSYRLYQFLVER